jgi:hypothetical protein
MRKQLDTRQVVVLDWVVGHHVLGTVTGGMA